MPWKQAFNTLLRFFRSQGYLQRQTHVTGFTVLICSLNGSQGSAAQARLFHPLSNEALSKSYYYQLVVALLLPIKGCMKQIISLSSVISSQVFMKHAICSECWTSTVSLEAEFVTSPRCPCRSFCCAPQKPACLESAWGVPAATYGMYPVSE